MRAFSAEGCKCREDSEYEYAVKTKKRLLPKQSIFQIECRTAAQPFKEDMTMLFQRDLNPQWLDG